MWQIHKFRDKEKEFNTGARQSRFTVVSVQNREFMLLSLFTNYCITYLYNPLLSTPYNYSLKEE